jgi:hypothetical protein
VSFRYLSSPTALDLLNYYFPHIYLWIVYLIIFFSMYFRSLSPISLLRKTLSKDVLVLILSELEFLHPMCSCPTFFFSFRVSFSTSCACLSFPRAGTQRYAFMRLICMLPPCRLLSVSSWVVLYHTHYTN